MNAWITKNYDKLLEICRNISKEYYCFDLFQTCIEQTLNNKVISTLSDREKTYFFTRLVLNNWNSSSSIYAQTYRKYKFMELSGKDIEIQEEKYIDLPDLDWVMKEIKKQKQGDNWYYARLFELYIEENCSLTKLSERTTIPINSVSRDIKKFREHLTKLRINYLQDGM